MIGMPQLAGLLDGEVLLVGVDDPDRGRRTRLISRMPPSDLSSLSRSRRICSSSFLVRLLPATSSKSISSSSLRRLIRWCTVWKLVSMPPSQRWLTKGIPTRFACSAIASWACFLVPTNITLPPLATAPLMKA